MRTTYSALALAGLILIGLARSQQNVPPPPLQPLVGCGAHGAVEIICGTSFPEDLEPTPDGKSLVVSQYVNEGRGGPGSGLVLFNLAAKTFTKMPVASEPLKDWGDPACPGPIGDALAPHGISLLKRSGGKMELYAVNHGGRESIEMYELRPAAGKWEVVWHGCVVSAHAFNDVAALPNGGFYASEPNALRVPGATLKPGDPSGFVGSWMPGRGLSEVPGTRCGYPNGVVATADGHYLYFNAFPAREVHKYDLQQGKDVGFVKLAFLPDNLTWMRDGHMLAAGVKGARGDCPAGSGMSCLQSFGVAEIDPAHMTARPVFDSEGKGALMTGVSVALQVGNDVYVGAFRENRLLKFGWKN